jgi:hypothetical protein
MITLSQLMSAQLVHRSLGPGYNYSDIEKHIDSPGKCRFTSDDNNKLVQTAEMFFPLVHCTEFTPSTSTFFQRTDFELESRITNEIRLKTFHQTACVQC